MMLAAALALFLVEPAHAGRSELESWISWERRVAAQKMVQNIHPSGTAPGVVIASPDHDYFFHWVRDAAIVMDTLRFEMPAEFLARVGDFAAFSRRNQLTPTPSGERNTGEPKFNVDGSAFIGPWGRPQDDGPAARASVLIAYAEWLLDRGKEAEARQLYDGQIPTQSVIKADLEYVSHHWKSTSFDLWEEIRGLHFFTRMVQRKALWQGARLASRLGDSGAAQWYQSQARQLEREIPRHWDPNRGIIHATIQRDGGVDYKSSGLDAAVVLGVLYAGLGDGFYTPAHPQVVATVEALTRRFSEIYLINRKTQQFAPAIGRYPEDQYFGGNPWILTTAALAEYHYQLAGELRRRGRLELNRLNTSFYEALMPGVSRLPKASLAAGATDFTALLSRVMAAGDSYLERVRYHSNPDGSLSEQIHRDSGYMTSMRDLTWSYASVLRAFWVRQQLSFARVRR